MNNMNCRNGFSLVELSIVLVILGLLVGGILGGQSLIRAAETRATIEQLRTYDLSMNTFRDKYLGIPGDISNGTQFWPGQTADGDGDGFIEAATVFSSYGYLTPDSPYFDGERPEFFRQLALAGIIAGQFDGSAVLNQGYPSIKMAPSAGMFASGPWYQSAGTNIANLGTYTKGSIYMSMVVGDPSAFNTSSSHNTPGIFMPEELWNIDTKIDDGTPLGGKLIAYSFNTVCISGSGSSAEYSLGTTSKTCGAMYELRR